MNNLYLLYEMQFSQYRIGREFVVTHLESEKGLKMNGRRCVVVGCDDANLRQPLERRIRVKLLNPDTRKPEGGILRIKHRNLVAPEMFSSVPSRSSIPPEETLRRLKIALQDAKSKGHDKPVKDKDFGDRPRRCKFLEPHLKNGKLPPPSGCMDLMLPVESMNIAEQIKEAVTPACYGDGKVDFTRFGEGLLLSSMEECAVCQEALVNKGGAEDAMMRLPCNHVFHVACSKPWLAEHETCPTCRMTLPNPWKTYVFPDPFEQVQQRLMEWFLSGMCERCQVGHGYMRVA